MNDQRNISALRHIAKFAHNSGLLFLLFVSACSMAAVPAMPAPLKDSPTEVPGTPAEGTTPTPEADPVYPYYMPLTFKPELEPQTINGVIVAIDWV